VGLTWYSRRTNDQLAMLTVPYGYLSQWGNVGDLAAHGFEATLGGTLLTTRLFNLDLNASYAYNTNRVVSLGSATGRQSVFGSLVVGYPLDASFGQTIQTFADSNADGIITGDEVTYTPVHFLGVFHAPRVYTVTPAVSLFGALVRVSALFDREMGGKQLDPYLTNCGQMGLCLDSYVKSTPLARQARVVALDHFCQGCVLVPSDFTRWRELSITSQLPTSWRQRLSLSNASVSFQVRNLMLWTDYTGPDPESVPGLGTVGQRSAQNGASGIPQPRSWTLRFDVSP